MKVNFHILAVAVVLGSVSLHAQDQIPPLPPGVPPPPAEPAPPDARRRVEDRAPREAERGPRVERDDRERREGPRRENPLRMLRGDRHSAHRLEPSAFLGIVTAPVAPALAAQLGLREGFGLLVEEVAPDSPAQAAGLKRYDVLKLLNEQQLVDVAQLTTLVRGMGKDAEVTVTFLRGGQEQKATVKLAEKMLPPSRPGADFALEHRLLDFGDFPRGAREAGEQHEQMRRFQEERMKTFQEEMERYQVRMREWQKAAGKAFPNPPLPPQPPQPPQGDVFKSRENLLHELRPGGAAEVRIYQPDGRTTFQTNNARVTMSHEGGELELVTTNGRRTFTAKDAAGGTIFSGPVDTAEQRERIPAPLAGKLELLADPNTVKLRVDGSEASASSSSTLPPAPAPEKPVDRDAAKHR